MFKLSPEERVQSPSIDLAHHDQPVDRQVLLPRTALVKISEKPRYSRKAESLPTLEPRLNSQGNKKVVRNN